MAARYSAMEYMALPNVVAPAHPDPLTRTRRRLFDDEPALIVDICRCGDATSEDGICVGGAKGKGRRSGAEQNEYARGLFLRNRSSLYGVAAPG